MGWGGLPWGLAWLSLLPHCPCIQWHTADHPLCFSPQVAAESLPPSDRVQVPKSIGEQGKNVQVAGAAEPLKGLGPSP